MTDADKIIIACAEMREMTKRALGNGISIGDRHYLMGQLVQRLDRELDRIQELAHRMRGLKK